MAPKNIQGRPKIDLRRLPCSNQRRCSTTHTDTIRNGPQATLHRLQNASNIACKFFSHLNHGPWSIHGSWSMAQHAWCIVYPWSMIHFLSMVHGVGGRGCHDVGAERKPFSYVLGCFLDGLSRFLDVFRMGFVGWSISFFFAPGTVCCAHRGGPITPVRVNAIKTIPPKTTQAALSEAV